MTVSLFLKRNFAGWEGLARNIQSHEKQGQQPRLLYPAKIFRIKRQIKSFPDKKIEEFVRPESLKKPDGPSELRSRVY